MERFGWLTTAYSSFHLVEFPSFFYVLSMINRVFVAPLICHVFEDLVFPLGFPGFVLKFPDRLMVFGPIGYYTGFQEGAGSCSDQFSREGSRWRAGLSVRCLPSTGFHHRGHVAWVLAALLVVWYSAAQVLSSKLELRSFMMWREWLEESGTLRLRPIPRRDLGKIQKLLEWTSGIDANSKWGAFLVSTTGGEGSTKRIRKLDNKKNEKHFDRK